MKFENTEVFNFEGALRGMRNPLQSHDKSDSYYLYEQDVEGKEHLTYKIGKNDLELAQRLILAGNEHAKFMRQILVSVDITGSQVFWSQMDTYKISTVANSTSKMHTLSKIPITRECFDMSDYEERLGFNELIDTTIDLLEAIRLNYLSTKDVAYWNLLLMLLPESWMQTRTWTANYAVLRNIYFQRRNHRMKFWHEFCEWIESLPYAKELIALEKKDV